MATFLEKLRATRAIWDEDEKEHALEQLRRDGEANPSARLILNIADEVMKSIRENFIPSSDKVDAFFPRHYVVLIGPDDEKYTRGERLPHIKGRVVEEVYKRLRTKRIDLRRVPERISIEIRVDATAGVGQVRVVAEDNPDRARKTPHIEVNDDDERRTEKDASHETRQTYELQIFLNGSIDQELIIEKTELIRV